jgi:FKBP-type peptidyl-prolyl cis-trans isomerase
MKQYLFLLALLAVLLVPFALQAQTNDKPPFTYKPEDLKSTPSGLKYVIIEEGKGPKPQKSDYISAHYHGMLENGKVFDSSYNRGNPFSFKIGHRQAIAGWDEAFLLFNEGTKAVIVVPPALGYGSEGMGDKIPANATLIFHVHLVKVSPAR